MPKHSTHACRAEDHGMGRDVHGIMLLVRVNVVPIAHIKGANRLTKAFR